MYKKILELTEEIEAVSAGDDHARLQELLNRRAAAFAVLEGQPPQSLPEETMAIIAQIQQCERRCQEQAARRLAALTEAMGKVRKGKRLEKAYGRFAGNV
jgi:hypothetical protein